MGSHGLATGQQSVLGTSLECVPFHIIAGLPRAGSTLLAGILRQNPRFIASIQSPLLPIVTAAVKAMSGPESAPLVTDSQRRGVLTGVVRGIYGDHNSERVVFDMNRGWTASLGLALVLTPAARVICCVRSPAWILDSIERFIQANPLSLSRLFEFEVGNVYSRVELLATRHLLAPSLNGLRQAWYGDNAARLIAIRYDSLVAEPKSIIDSLYDLLGERRFEHDFNDVAYEEAEFDDRLGLPGLHRVAGPVRPRPRQTILPPDLFSLYDREFWRENNANPRGVVIL